MMPFGPDVQRITDEPTCRLPHAANWVGGGGRWRRRKSCFSKGGGGRRSREGHGGTSVGPSDATLGLEEPVGHSIWVNGLLAHAWAEKGYGGSGQVVLPPTDESAG